MSEDLPRYFGGKSAFTAEVGGIKAKDFPELVTRYFHNAIQLTITRKEYQALDEDAQKRAKNVAYVNACRFKSDPCKRCDANATEMVLAFFDIDSGSTARKIQEDPSVILEALHPLNVVVYRTASYTEADPRYRIVVDLEGCDPKDYKRVIDYIAKRLGFPGEWSGSRESHVVSQPFYRPVSYAKDKGTPVVCSRTTGTALSIEEVPTVEAEVDELLEGKTYSFGPADPETIGLGYMPKTGITPEDIREPLFSIDPDCDYRKWTQTIAACRHQFRDEDEAREVFEMLVDWSSGGDKYKGEKEVWAKWRSFKADPVGKAPVTVATLFKYAIDAGWNSTKLATVLKGTIAEWIASCEDPDELMKEGPERIASMPFRNEVVEDSLIISLKDRIKEVNGQGVAKVSIFREVAKARKRSAASKREERDADPVPEVFAPIVYVATEDRFRHCGTGVSFTTAAFDRKYSRELMPKDPAEIPADGKPPILPSNYLLNTLQIPTVDETLYYPRNTETFVTINDRVYLNTYNPLSPPSADPDFSEEAGALLILLLTTMFGNPRYVRIMLDFIASNVQFPGRKILWAILTQSVQGAGKGMLSDIIRAAMGSINVRESPPEVVNDKWNDHYAVGVILNFWNEIHIPGERRARMTNALKSVITDEIITIIQKYRDPREVINMVNHMAWTNATNAIHLEPGDRRWCILQSIIQTKERAQELADSGFYKQFEILKKEWAGAVRYFLQQHKISEDFPYKGPAPITEFRQALIEEGVNVVQTAIEDLVADEGDPFVGSDVVSTTHLNQSLSVEVKRQGAKPTHYLQLMGYKKWRGRTRPVVGGIRTDIWVHPDRFIEGLGTPQETLDWRIHSNGNLISI